MGFLFDFLGNIFGYVLWFFFDAVSNYAVAITFFTVVINLLMLPFAIKRQKTTALNARINVKQQELRKRYEKDTKKYNEELSRLYEKEGVSPMTGCFSTMVLPLILWSGIFGAVTRPLQNTLHIPSDKVAAAVSVLPQLPSLQGKITAGYEQLQLVRHFSEVKDSLTMLSPSEFADVQEYSYGFDFFGINLLNRPNAAAFSEMLWIIPVLCFISSALALFINQKIMGNAAPQAAGCAKFLPYAMTLFTAYIAYTIPAAVGLYWFVNAMVGVVQSLVLNKFYNVYTVNASSEAARLALMEVNEAKAVRVKDLKSIKRT